MISFWFFFIMFALIWGSFLNVIACRLMTNQSIVHPRSHCPHCKKTIAWYDNIPVLSWILLGGKCRSCKRKISFLYPFIEVLSAGIFALLYANVPDYFIAHALFFSALIVTIRTDLEHMLISRLATIGMIPLAFILSYLGMLPINLSESLFGTVVGYLALWIVARIFYGLTGKHGLGEGDFDLLALIGAFCGAEGVFITILIGSWVGTVVSMIYIVASKKKNLQIKVPFGPFLALGAISYVIWHNAIERFLTYLA